MLSRATVSRSHVLLVSRKQIPRRLWLRRKTSDSRVTSGGVSASHVLAGVAGGSIVILAGYAYYHMSGLSNVFQVVNNVKNFFRSTKGEVTQKVQGSSRNASQTLLYLRNVAKSYVAPVPLGPSYVDKAFDAFDELYQVHEEEAGAILQEAAQELMKVAGKGEPAVGTATQVFHILRRMTNRFQELGMKAGATFTKNNPDFEEKLVAGYDQLQSLAERGVTGARDTFSDVSRQLKEVVSKGMLDDQRVRGVKDLIQENASKLKGLVDARAREIGKSLSSGNTIEDNQASHQDTVDNIIPR